MLRGAIIGLGNVALDVHVPGWARREDVDIVAVTDVREGCRAECAERLPQARWYDSAEALLAEAAVDFVDICTPPASHARLSARALARGRHVLCEKPLVCSADELIAVTDQAAASGRVLHTVHNWHHAPIVTRTAELVRDGVIGRVRRIVWHTLRTQPATVRDQQSNWRMNPALGGGGILTDHGWHVFYLIQRWVGEAPVSVSARLETRRHTAWPVEDTADVRVTFPHAVAEIFLTWASQARDNWAVVEGSDGSIELRDDVLALTRDGHVQRWACPPPLSSGSVHPDWFDPVAREFIDAVMGTDTSEDNLAEASLCATLESLARESSRHGGRALATPPPVAP
jgi:predicted dehydrogenase